MLIRDKSVYINNELSFFLMPKGQQLRSLRTTTVSSSELPKQNKL